MSASDFSNEILYLPAFAFLIYPSEVPACTISNGQKRNRNENQTLKNVFELFNTSTKGEEKYF